MRVLLGAALVAGASAAHHQECAHASCTTCADDFAECGGTDLANPGTIAADKQANCALRLNDILAQGEAAGAASQAICEGYTGTFTAAVAATGATWTAAAAATCIGADGNEVGDNTDAEACQVAPTYVAAVTEGCVDGTDTATGDANQGDCEGNGNTWNDAAAATCSLGGDATGDEAACTGSVPVFTAAVVQGCNDAGNTEPANQTDCEALQTAPSDASCDLGHDASLAAATYSGDCTAAKAAECLGSCKEVVKGSAGSADDDGSAASPAAMIATSMAFLALFL